ncbi:MAG: glycosyltransferase [Deltaproteobacteria bacterium]|nr:glycosyltransferase [Deltaproteobacteria bacterium]
MDILQTALEVSFWLGVSWVFYIYQGYGWLLQALVLLAPRKTPPLQEGPKPRMTVLLTVHNEEAKLPARLENLYRLRYPEGMLEILVVSDGSTDGTNGLLESEAARGRLRWLATSRLGKSGAQNAAMTLAQGDVVLITDAGTAFDDGFAQVVGERFADPRVGCITGHLMFARSDGALSKNQGLYWNYELWLRRMESRLGILAVASGPVLAFRKTLFQPLPLNAGDDCMIPLHVARQGALVQHVEQALAWDALEHEAGREFRTRVRFTIRNWSGTWMEPSLLNPFRHPGYAFALWSHKLLRWLSPLGATVSLIAGLFLLDQPLVLTLTVLLWAGMLGAAAGWALDRKGISLPVLGTLFSFALANTAFAVGVIKALRGAHITAYRSGTLDQT